MSEKPIDPMAMFNQMLGQFEQGFNEMATKAMGSEDFSRIMNTMGGASMGAKKTMGDMMERYLATMNLPSRQELTNIGERLQAVEARLNEIIAILHRAHPDVGGLVKPTAAPRPPRTRKPPPAGSKA
ncbi:MAG TPA: poly(R)-hydroxyalkanoic acid synthase subunit PhaE [Beijerinckiaceae bacterium]|nr:poly(R)-hydroxyalkanoic acid synthase subunit PhaE [Beijerinckiaceae bacterium]